MTGQKQPSGNGFGEVRWLITKLRSTVGLARLAMVALGGFFGTVVVLVAGIGALAAIQVAGSEADDSFRGLPVPDISLGWLIFGIAAIGLVGAAVIIRVDIASIRIAAEIARVVRERIAGSIDLEDASTVSALVVQDTREVALAARGLLRLPGPVSLVALGGIGLAVLDPILLAVLVPVGAGVAFFARGFRVDTEEVSQRLADSRLEARDRARNLDPDSDDNDLGALLHEAGRGDRAALELSGGSSRVQATGVVSLSALIVVALIVISLRGGFENGDELLRTLGFAFLLRFVVRAAQQTVTVTNGVLRRSDALARCRSASEN